LTSQVERRVVNQLAAAYEQQLLPKGCTLRLTVQRGDQDRDQGDQDQGDQDPDRDRRSPSLRLQVVGEDSSSRTLDIRPPLSPDH